MGVKRQYSGTAGKVENCQIGVFLAYGSRRGAAFLDRELYLPQEWAADWVRRQEAGVPEGVAFRTKAQLAQEMIGRAVAAGVPFAWVTGDRPASAPPKAPADRRQPPVYPNSSPDHRACNSLTLLPLSSRRLAHAFLAVIRVHRWIRGKAPHGCLFVGLGLAAGDFRWASLLSRSVLPSALCRSPRCIYAFRFDRSPEFVYSSTHCFDVFVGKPVSVRSAEFCHETISEVRLCGEDMSNFVGNYGAV